VVSLAACLVLTRINPASAFYLPWARAWELLCGGCLACVPAVLGDTDRTRFAGIASGAGIMLVVVPFFTFGGNDPFPGWRAILPVAGTSLLVAAGSRAWFNRTVLAHPAMVSVGLISYPLYLWHWPAISIPEIVGAGSPLVKAVGVAVSFVLAWATYRLVERPIRRSANANAIWLLAAMTAVGAIGLAAKRTIILPRSHSPELADILSARADWLSPEEGSVAIPFKGQTFRKDGSNPDVTLVIGDSNAEQYFARTHRLIGSGSANLSAVFAAGPSCLPIPGVAPIETPACEDFVVDAFEFARMTRVRTVVVAAQWFYSEAPDRYHLRRNGRSLALSEPDGRQAAFDSLRDQLAELRKLGKRTVVVMNIPVGREFAPIARIERRLGGIRLLPPPQPTLDDVMKPHAAVLEQLTRIARESGSEIIDPARYLCTPRCTSANEAGAPIYKDSVHLRSAFVRDHATFIDDILR